MLLLVLSTVINSNQRSLNTLDIQSPSSEQNMFREDIGEYVAQLQLHMALQARNLVPTLNDASVNTSRHQMLQETQAIIEKFASRQSL